MKSASRAFWDATSARGLHPLTWLGFFYRDTIFCFPESKHPGVAGHVALTIDDGICRQGADCCLADEVRTLLLEYGAKATFFVCSEYVKGFEDDARQFVQDGHELANHMTEDRGDYVTMSTPKFESLLADSTRLLNSLSGPTRFGGFDQVRWFRAPQV